MGARGHGLAPLQRRDKLGSHMGGTATSRTLRGLVTGLVCALGLAGASAARAQDNGTPGALEAVPTNGLQLVSGEFLNGKVLEEYWRSGAAAGEVSEGVVLLREDRTKLFVPHRYLSAEQNYLFYRSQLYPPATQHPVFRRDPNAPARPLEWGWVWTLADLGLMANRWNEAKQHFDDCFALAEAQEGPAKVKELQPYLAQRLSTLGIFVSTKDARWVTLEVFYTEQGMAQWGREWLPLAEIERLKKEARDQAKRSLSLSDPANYSRVHLQLVRAFPGEWKQRGAAKVHFFARYLDQMDEKFAKVGKFSPADYVRLRVTFDDCDHVYVSKKNKLLMDRLGAFTTGTSMVLYGRLVVESGVVLIECEDLALR